MNRRDHVTEGQLMPGEHEIRVRARSPEVGRYTIEEGRRDLYFAIQEAFLELDQGRHPNAAKKRARCALNTLMAFFLHHAEHRKFIRALADWGETANEEPDDSDVADAADLILTWIRKLHDGSAQS
jgi:hypothetical protein